MIIDKNTIEFVEMPIIPDLANRGCIDQFVFIKCKKDLGSSFSIYEINALINAFEVLHPIVGFWN